MRPIAELNVYRESVDVDYLRAIVDALSGLVAEVDSDPDVTSSAPGVDRPRLAGQRAVRTMALRRRQWAMDRLAELLGDAPRRRPVVLDAFDCVPLRSLQGQPLTPLITAGAAGTSWLSSALVWMPPGHAAFAHIHHHTDVGVVVLQGKAITLWWDERGTINDLPQRAGQHLHIPYGVPHTAINPFDQPVVAVEFRSNRNFDFDNERLPALDGEVHARLQTPRAA
jgi:uncharacterized RmlC-like cupin family protein